MNSAMNFQAFNTFEEVSTVYRIFSSTIRLSPRTKKKNQFGIPLYNWYLLTTNIYLKEQYTFAVKNKFETLQADTEEPFPNTT